MIPKVDPQLTQIAQMKIFKSVASVNSVDKKA